MYQNYGNLNFILRKKYKDEFDRLSGNLDFLKNDFFSISNLIYKYCNLNI